jgi:C1A family cysteine protease
MKEGLNMIYNIKRQKEDERDFQFAVRVDAPKRQALPKKADLRAECPVVFDQGQLGSCSANAGCADIAMTLKDPKLILSRLYMYYKERELEGSINEDSGAQMRDICKVAAQGVCEEKYFPYVIEDFAKAPTAEAAANAITHKVTSYHAVKTLTEIKQAVGLHDQAVLMGMEVFESFEGEAIAKTGVMTMPKRGEQNLGGHAVLIVGYDDDKQVLIVRNSWGDSWGDKGYFYMPYKYISQGLAFDFWVLS